MTEVSVIVASGERAEAPRGCLDALARQTATADTYEVVVAGRWPTRRTEQLLAGYAATFASVSLGPNVAGEQPR